MPELPEVETVARDLKAASLVGRRIEAVHVRWPRIIATPAPAVFVERLRGTRIRDVGRRAKYLVLPLDTGDTLLIHLRMTGRLALPPSEHPLDPHEHLILTLDDGRDVRYHDTRKFGRWYLVDDPAQVLGDLGPEPLSEAFTPTWFYNALHARRRQLKPLLLDQRFIAGLGNIYVDEALWHARLHPQRLSQTLSRTESDALHTAIRTVLERAIVNMGTTLGTGEANFYSVGRRRGRNQDALAVFRRTGELCPRCGTPIVRLVVAQRGTHICPACQPPSQKKWHVR